MNFRNQKEKSVLFFALLAMVFAFWGLLSARAEEKPRKVVATTGMVADLVRQVGGDRVVVRQMMGAGIDPHSYKATQADAAALAKADAIFYNGLLLEGRLTEVFETMRKRGKSVYALSDAIPKSELLHPEDSQAHFDPHLWFSVSLWAKTIPAVVRGLSEADPEGKATYEKNGEEVAARLAALDAWCKETLASVPQERRILVTSHDAYSYFGREYGFQVIGLQGVSTVSEAALADFGAMVDFIKEQQVPAIFVESSVNPAGIRRIAQDAGVKIGGELFSDAMGEPGEMLLGYDTGTYEGMVRYNMQTIATSLQ